MRKMSVLLFSLCLFWFAHCSVAAAQHSLTHSLKHGSATLIPVPEGAVNAVGFLNSVASSGNTVVLGAVKTVVASNPEVGAAFVFERPKGGWTGTLQQSATLIAADQAAFDFLGFSVAVSDDVVLAVGIKGMYVFLKPKGGWSGVITESALLTASQGQATGPVAIDGDTVAAGGSFGLGQGDVLVFLRPRQGWSGTVHESARLIASDGANFDALGSSVAIDDKTVVAGAPNAAVDSNSFQGAAYVFRRPSGGWSGTISQSAKLVASDGGADNFLGSSVAIDHRTIVVGAPNAAGLTGDTGAAYVFTRPEGSWSGQLTENAKLISSTGVAGDNLGFSVGISNELAVAGGPITGSPQPHTGTVYVFDRPEGGWSGTHLEDAQLTAPGSSLFFGSAISLSRGVLSAADPAALQSPPGAGYAIPVGNP